jgi:lysophospholipase L1-like esterase
MNATGDERDRPRFALVEQNRTVMTVRLRPAYRGAVIVCAMALLGACAAARGSTSGSPSTTVPTPIAQPANPDQKIVTVTNAHPTTSTTVRGTSSTSVRPTLSAPTPTAAPTTAAPTTVQTFPLPALADLGFGKDLANLVPVTMDPAITDKRLFLLGDSVMASLAPRYTDEGRKVLEPLGWQLTLDAEVSRSPLGAVLELKKRQRDIPEVVVILIGHNYGGNLPVVTQQFHDIMAQLTKPKKIVFLLNEEFKKSIADVNNVIRDLAKADPRIHVVDWNAVSTGPAFRGPDNVHLTPLGAKLLAVIIAQAVGAAPR